MALILYVSYFMAKKGQRIREFSTGFLPPVFLAGSMSALVVAQPDFGGAFLFMALLLLMMFVGGARLHHLAASLIALAPVVYMLVVSAPYRLRRITAFLDPWSDPTDTGFHIIQSYLAFGSGGLWGQGLGNSRQKLFYLPESHTDFILSVVGEELGFFGVAAVVVLFCILVTCGIRIAYATRNLYGLYLAFGLTALLGMQALVNMGVVMGLLPTKGTTLPFISYGGTSLLVSLTAVGILLNIGSQSRV
jgi:cell division protein FtsW